MRLWSKESIHVGRACLTERNYEREKPCPMLYKKQKAQRDALWSLRTWVRKPLEKRQKAIRKKKKPPKEMLYGVHALEFTHFRKYEREKPCSALLLYKSTYRNNTRIHLLYKSTYRNNTRLASTLRANMAKRFLYSLAPLPSTLSSSLSPPPNRWQ